MSLKNQQAKDARRILAVGRHAGNQVAEAKRQSARKRRREAKRDPEGATTHGYKGHLA
jgi:hypothetical protein